MTAVLVVLAVGAGLGMRASAAQGAERSIEELQAEAVRLTAQNDLLKKRQQLASGEAFYLLVDVPGGHLELVLKGVVLRRYALLGAETGVRRIVFSDQDAPEQWQTRVWAMGNLVPSRDRERVEMKVEVKDTKPSDQSEAAAPAPPPTAEELYPVPDRYEIRFGEDFALEVRRATEEGADGWWPRLKSRVSGWFAERVAAANSETARFRITLQVADAVSLYRSLPPDVSLLLIPPLAAE